MISLQKISSAAIVATLLQLSAVQRTEAKNGWVVTTWEGTLKILSVDLAEVRKLECRCPKVPKKKKITKFLEKNIGEIKQDAMNYEFLYLEDDESPDEVLKGKMAEFNTYYKNISDVWEKMRNLLWADLENHKEGRDADTFENIETLEDFEDALEKFDKRYPGGPRTARVDSLEEKPKKPRTKRQHSTPCAIGVNVDFDDLSTRSEASETVSPVPAEEKSVTCKGEYSVTVNFTEPEYTFSDTKSSEIDADGQLPEEEPTTYSRSDTDAPESVSLSSFNGRRRRLAIARLVAAECSKF